MDDGLPHREDVFIGVPSSLYALENYDNLRPGKKVVRMAIVLDYGKHMIGRPPERLLIRLATELGEPRQCFAPEDSSLSGVCDFEIYE